MSDAAGRFEGDPAVRAVDGGLEPRDVAVRANEVIEQYHVSAGGDGLVELVQVGDLDLDALAWRGPVLRAFDGRRDPARRADVVLLDEEAVVQAGPVIAAAADPHGVLLQDA